MAWLFWKQDANLVDFAGFILIRLAEVPNPWRQAAAGLPFIVFSVQLIIDLLQTVMFWGIGLKRGGQNTWNGTTLHIQFLRLEILIFCIKLLRILPLFCFVLHVKHCHLPLVWVVSFFRFSKSTSPQADKRYLSEAGWDLMIFGVCSFMDFSFLFPQERYWKKSLVS